MLLQKVPLCIVLDPSGANAGVLKVAATLTPVRSWMSCLPQPQLLLAKMIWTLRRERWKYRHHHQAGQQQQQAGQQQQAVAAAGRSMAMLSMVINSSSSRRGMCSMEGKIMMHTTHSSSSRVMKGSMAGTIR
jgi:hypothetical protein